MPDHTAADPAADMTPEPTLAERAAAVRERVAAVLSEAQSMVTTAGELEARAARLRRDAQTLANATLGEDRKAADLDARARSAAIAAQREAQAAEADRVAEALRAERDHLIEQIGQVEERRDQFRAEQAEAGRQLATAGRRADVDGITAARGRAASLAEVLADLGRQVAGPQARVRAIGDGQDDGGELAATLAAAARHRREARQAMNNAHPDRPEAVHDREVAARRALLDRIAPSAPSRATPHSYANLTTGEIS